MKAVIALALLCVLSVYTVDAAAHLKHLRKPQPQPPVPGTLSPKANAAQYRPSPLKPNVGNFKGKSVTVIPAKQGVSPTVGKISVIAPKATTPTTPAVDASKLHDGCHKYHGWNNAIGCLTKGKDSNGKACRYVFSQRLCVSQSDKCGVSINVYGGAGPCEAMMKSEDVVGKAQSGPGPNFENKVMWCRVLREAEAMRVSKINQISIPSLEMDCYPTCYRSQGC